MIDGYFGKAQAQTSDLGWTSREWPGMEHVIASVGGAGVTAESQMILADGDLASVAYRLECDAAWRFVRLDVMVATAGGTSRMSLSVNDEGQWSADGVAQPGLEGCVDIDIDRTPITNTLPIRRLAWSPGTVHDLEVAYVSIPDLSVRRVQQRYTLLDRGEGPGPATFRYEAGDFRVDLPVDGDGFVMDYPGFWDRIQPLPKAAA